MKTLFIQYRVNIVILGKVQTESTKMNKNFPKNDLNTEIHKNKSKPLIYSKPTEVETNGLFRKTFDNIFKISNQIVSIKWTILREKKLIFFYFLFQTE